MSNLTALVEVTGSRELPTGGIITIPNALATADVYSVFLDNDERVDAMAIRSERIGGELGFTRYVVPNDWTPGEYRATLVPTELRSEGAPFLAHPSVRNDPHELLAKISGLPGGQSVEWILHPAGWEVFKSAGELRWLIRGRTPGSPKINAFLQLDMTATKPLVNFEIGLAFHDEDVAEWFVNGGRPRIAFPEAEIVRVDMTIEDGADGLGFRDGAMYLARGTFVCLDANPVVTNAEGELIFDEENDPTWTQDGTVGEVFMRLDAQHWNGYAGTMRGVLADLDPLAPLPRPYTSEKGARQIDRTAQTGDNDSFGPCLDTAAFVSADLETVFGGLTRGVIGEAARPIHFFDDQGLPLDLDTRPGCTTLHSQPDSRFSTDMLGRPNGWAVFGAMTAQDESHMSHRYTFTALYLRGDRAPREVLRAQANVLWKTIHDYTGQERLVGRTTLFARQFAEVAPDPEWARRMKVFSRARLNAYLTRIRAHDAALGVTDFRTAPVYYGPVDSHPAGYALGMSAETVAIAPFQMSLAALGILAWRLRDPEAVPEDLFERFVRVAESVFEQAVWTVPSIAAPGGEVVYTAYAVGWNNGQPITDRTDGVHLRNPRPPSTPVRGTLYPLAWIVENYGTREPAKAMARKLVAIDRDTFGNARWRAIRATAP